VVKAGSNKFATLLAGALLCTGSTFASFAQSASVRNVNVLGTGGSVAIEIEASERVTPQALVLSGPDRLVLDFPNATPGHGLRSRSVGRGDVKGVRVGLFSSNPPTTRIVVDLNGPVPYQLFPQGKSVIVKLGATVASTDPPAPPALVNAKFAETQPAAPAPPVPKPAPPKPLDVAFRNGLLSIRANRVSLSEVLFAVQQRTGADIAIPAGAEQEKVAVNDGPAPAAEVLAHLLNGSKFNFLIVNSASDPRVLDKVVLTLRPEGSYTPSPAAPSEDDDQAAIVTAHRPPPVETGDPAIAIAQDAPQDEASPAANAIPNNNTFPNARPAPVKTAEQDNGDTPD